MDNKYIEVRWHGRGGQGAVTAAEILAEAAYYDGYKGVTAAPFFGAERRGAPVIAYKQVRARAGEDLLPRSEARGSGRAG